MKIPALFLLGSLMLSCGGGGSASVPEADACNEAAKTACVKIYSCPDLVMLATPSVGTEAQCETMVLAQCGATGFQCSAGETYHGDKAQTCKDQFNAQDCGTLLVSLLSAFSSSGGSTSAAISGITQNVPACNQICTTP
ncbi:MAG TPA: hypothetical protein VGP07_02010 [Polyangia bacterium]|jgi:hypothetical protein